MNDIERMREINALRARNKILADEVKIRTDELLHIADRLGLTLLEATPQGIDIALDALLIYPDRKG